MKRAAVASLRARTSLVPFHRCLATRTATTAASTPGAGARSASNTQTSAASRQSTDPSPDASPPSQTSPTVGNGAGLGETNGAIDWSRSFHGLSERAFPREACDALLAPLDADDIEIKPDGLLYLPEIKYRRILNKAFGPGGWGLAPRSETFVSAGNVSREYALVVQGRLVSIARGEQEYFPAKDISSSSSSASSDGSNGGGAGGGGGKNQDGIPTATEGAKSNALMRCCKDLGIASELWDPGFIRKWKKEHAKEEFVEHQATKRKRKLWRRKDVAWEYPYKVASFS